MKKNLKAGILTIVFSIVLAGCGGMPELTEEETDMVSQYSAGLLLKYDSTKHSRLVDTSAFVNEYNLLKKAHDDAEQAYYDNLREEEEERLKELSEQEEANKSSNDSLNNGDTAETDDGTGGATVITNETIGEALGEPELSIEYGGYDLMTNYPEEADEFYFTVEASSGSKLLVVYFNMKNTSEETVSVDLMSKNIKYKLSINGESGKSALTTLLDDDLKEYVGELAPNESERVVLIAEVPDDTTVDSLSLSVKSDTGSINKNLK